MFKTSPPVNLKFYKGYIDPECLNYSKFLKTEEELKMITKELEEIKMLNIINTDIKDINEAGSNLQLLHTEYTKEWRDTNGYKSLCSDSDNKNSKE
jgi:hypothetical protein